jgi:lipopolysaccharide transport system permease protein
MGAYQSILVYRRWPDWQAILFVMLLALGLCALGLRLFRRRSGEMVDEL